MSSILWERPRGLRLRAQAPRGREARQAHVRHTTNIYIYIYTHVSMYLHARVCVYIYIYRHTYT